MKREQKLTREEQERQAQVKRLCYQKIALIIETRKLCDLTVQELCININIDDATYYRYESHESCINIEHYIHCCMFFRDYVQKHDLLNKEKAMKNIEQLEQLEI